MVCCCWPGFPCFGATRWAASHLGFYPVTVTLEDIVIGNIPLEGDGVLSMIPGISNLVSKSADLYVEVECNINPVLSTRVETSNGEIVNYGDTLSLNIHDSWLESDVHFRVMDMDVVAHDEVAYLSLDPKTLIHLAHTKDGPLRFQLKMAGGSDKKKRKVSPDAVPWISFTASISQNNDSGKRKLRYEHLRTHPVLTDEGNVLNAANM
jgi:hypothetical protein